MKTTARILFCVLAAASCALAQTSFGTIRGSVADASGAGIPGAAVVISNTDTGISRTVSTDGTGNYMAPSLQPGPYSISVEARGFKKQVHSGLRLPVNGAIQVSSTLEVGEIRESVEVTGEAPMLNASNSTIGTVVGNQTIVNMPLNGRQFTQLILLVPGTSPRQPPASAMDNNLRGISPAVNGARPQNNNFTLDGAENNESMFNSFGVSPSVDAIQEFKIQSNISSAEFGKAAGANINISFKSGSNQLHGVAYEYLRNAKLDARNAFQPARGPYKQNQFGGTLGGPVFIPRLYDGRNRTFFFFAAEGFRMRKALTPPTSLVPAPAQFAGDLSGGAQIYDPWTTRIDAGKTVRDPFAGNRIPADRINRASAVIAAQFYPAPNLTGVTGKNLINPKGQRQDDNQWNLRIDQKLGSNNTLFGRFSLNNRQRTDPTAFPKIDNTLFNRNRNFVLSDTHLFSAGTILDAKFAFNRTYLATYNTALNPDLLFGQTGIQGYVIQSQQFPMFPIIGITSFAGIAQDATLFGPLNNFQYLVAATHIRGAHTFKAGTDIKRQQFFTGSYRAGNIGFDNIPTANPQSRSNTGQALASFLLGVPSSAQRVVGDTNVRMRGTNIHFFLQDDIRATRRLTLNLGLRYEYNQLPYEKNNRMSAFDLRNGNILWAAKNPITGEPPNVRKNITDPDWNNFAPRIGIAYSLNSKTTLRAGSGVFYNSNFIQEQQGGRGQWPFALSQSDSGLNQDYPERPFNRLFPVDPASVIAFSGTRNIAGRTGYSIQWSASIQRQITPSFSLEADYIGSTGHKLFTNWRANPAPPGPGAINPRRPFPQFGTISEENPRGNNNYNGLLLKAERRYAKGFTVLASYTWSKSIDDSSALTNLSQNNPFTLRLERGPSEYDLRHNFVVTYVWDIPFGSTLRGAARQLLHGWQVNGITVARTGFPIKIVLPTDTANTGVSGGQRPNLVGTLEVPASERRVSRWFNTSALVAPAQYTFGNLGRNVFFGPGVLNFDFGAYKNFPIGERHKIQFRAEFFNILNNVNLGQPGATLNTSTFGVITGTSTDAR